MTPDSTDKLPAEVGEKPMSLHAAGMLAALVLLSAALFGHRMTVLCENGLGRSTTDMASINQAVWNTAHGSILQATILYEGVRDHFEPVLLLYSINYLVGGNLHTLLYIHAFLVALGAVPFYLASLHRNRSAMEATVAALLYLLFPALHQMVDTNYLRPDLLFFPVLSLMGYALVFANRRALLASVILTLACKESGSLIVFGLGVYCLVVRRQYRLGATLAAVGLAWMPLVSLKLLPWAIGFTPHHGSRLRPVSVDQFTRLRHIGWPLVTLSATALLLCRRRWPAVVTVPHSLSILFFVPRLRYAVPSLPIPCFLVTDEICRLSRKRLRISLLAATLALLLLVNLRLGVWARIPASPDIDAARPLMELIPSHASVCADDALLVHLSSRPALYAFNRRHYNPINGRDYLDAEYFLIRRQKVETKYGSVRRHKRHSRAVEEVDALGMKTVAESPPFILYRRLNPAAL